MKTKKQILTEMIEAIDDKATNQPTKFKAATAKRRAKYVKRLKKLS
jgi:hypothetical protein